MKKHREGPEDSRVSVLSYLLKTREMLNECEELARYIKLKKEDRSCTMIAKDTQGVLR